MSFGPQSLPLIVELHDPVAHICLPSVLMWGECSSGVAMLLLNCTFWNLSAQSFSIASRPKVGPSCSTLTASSVKFAATAAASFLSSASVCFFMAATSFSRSCGSGVSFCWTKVGRAKLIASPNVNRRHLNKGQQAMAVAFAYPEPERGRGKKDKGAENASFSQRRLKQARQVLNHS